MPPVQNDLTPEDEAEFAKHGIPTAGPGREPLSEEPPAQQEAATPAEGEGEQAGEPAAGAEPEGTIKVKRDPQTGRFIPAEDGDGAQEPPAEQAAQEKKPKVETPPPAGMVPHAALHEQREENKVLRNQINTLSNRMTALMNKLSTGEKQAPPEMPDLMQEPVAFIQALGDRLVKLETGLTETSEEAAVTRGIETDENNFKLIQPDYEDAAEFYVQSRAKELGLMYAPEQIQDMLYREARSLAKQSWQAGRSMAQTIYGIAQARGYAPQQQQQQQQQQQRPSLTPAKIVEAAKNGAGHSRSLSAGVGASAPETLNAEALLSMSDEEFEAAFGLGKKGADARFRQIAGN